MRTPPAVPQQPLFDDAQDVERAAIVADERRDELRMVVRVDHYPGHILFLQIGEVPFEKGLASDVWGCGGLHLLRGRAGFGGTKGYL